VDAKASALGSRIVAARHVRFHCHRSEAISVIAGHAVRVWPRRFDLSSRPVKVFQGSLGIRHGIFRASSHAAADCRLRSIGTPRHPFPITFRQSLDGQVIASATCTSHCRCQKFRISVSPRIVHNRDLLDY
jgi:hypothetical protein